MNKIYKQNRNRLVDTENRLTTVRGVGVGRLGEKGKGLRKKKNPKHQTSQTQTTVWWLPEGKEVGGEVEEKKW